MRMWPQGGLCAQLLRSWGSEEGGGWKAGSDLVNEDPSRPHLSAFYSTDIRSGAGLTAAEAP